MPGPSEEAAAAQGGAHVPSLLGADRLEAGTAAHSPHACASPTHREAESRPADVPGGRPEAGRFRAAGSVGTTPVWWLCKWNHLTQHTQQSSCRRDAEGPTGRAWHPHASAAACCMIVCCADLPWVPRGCLMHVVAADGVRGA